MAAWVLGRGFLVGLRWIDGFGEIGDGFVAERERERERVFIDLKMLKLRERVMMLLFLVMILFTNPKMFWRESDMVTAIQITNLIG